MVNGKRLSTTLGRYPEVSLADARSKALRIRQSFVETGTRPNPKKIQPDKESGSHSPLNGSTDDTIDSLLPEYLHYRYDELLESKTNKHPDKAVLVMEARYRKHLAPLIGKLHPRQLNNQLVIACLAPIASRKAERTKCLAIVSGLAKWFLLKGLLDANALPIQQEVIRMALPRCKIHLIPPGRAKFPPSHLKSRGGWLHKIKLLASGLAWRAPGLCSLQTCPQL